MQIKDRTVEPSRKEIIGLIEDAIDGLRVDCIDVDTKYHNLVFSDLDVFKRVLKHLDPTNKYIRDDKVCECGWLLDTDWESCPSCGKPQK